MYYNKSINLMIPMQKKTNQSIKKRFFSATILKPVICASTVFLADRFILKNLNTKSNLAFASSVGGGVMIASSIGEATKNMFYTNTIVGSLGKNLEEARIIETLSGSSIAYYVNRFVFKNDYNNKDLLNKLGIIVFSDFVAESITTMIINM